VTNWVERRLSHGESLLLGIILTSRGGIGIIAGTVLQTAAVNYEMMCVARVFNGIFNGLLTSTVPSYQSECAKPHQRGPLVILSGTLIGFVGLTNQQPECEADQKGIMCSYWVGLGFYYTSGDIQWRFPIAFQAIFTIIM
jgi:MFS family permease